MDKVCEGECNARESESISDKQQWGEFIGSYRDTVRERLCNDNRNIVVMWSTQLPRGVTERVEE